MLHRTGHRFELVEAVGAYCQHRAVTGRDDATKTARVHSLEAGAGLKSVQQKIAEAKLKKENGLWVLISRVVQQWRMNATEFRTAVLRLPARIRARLDLPVETESVIEEIVDSMLAELAQKVDAVGDESAQREAAE